MIKQDKEMENDRTLSGKDKKKGSGLPILITVRELQTSLIKFTLYMKNICVFFFFSFY